MSEIITGGINLMAMGMGTVFTFLALLVIGTTLMSQIIMRLPNTNEMDTSLAASTRARQDDLAEVAAVAAAVKLVHK